MTPARLRVSVPSAELASALADLPEDVELLEWSMDAPAPVDAIDIVIPPYLSSTAPLALLRTMTVRLVQSQSVGYDRVAEALPPGLVFANAASVHEASTAELALGLIIAAQRGIPDFVRAAQRGQWAQRFYPSLADRKVLLLGYGGVGRAIEARLEPFEVEITRVARHARTGPKGPVHGLEDLPGLLADADVVVVAVPLDDTTEGLVDDAFLARVRDGALVVNVARGRVADTDALVRHAASGRLRLALDVVDPEPLPAGHPLWDLPNVLLTPHVGGATSAMLPRMVRLVREQIDRLRRGDEPLNVVLRT